VPNNCLDVSQQAALEHGKAIAIHVLAIVALQRGERDRARTLNEDALVLARQLTDDWLVRSSRTTWCLLMEEGEFERAAELFEESLAIGEARGDLDRRARALVNLGYAAHCLGDGARAHELYRRALTAAEEIGLVEAQLWALLGVATYEAEGGQAVRGRAPARPRQAVGVGSPQRRGRPGRGVQRRTLAALHLALAPERLAAELAAGAALSLEDAIDLALGRSGVQTPQAAASTSD